eukprot:jgi/Botrbrau1/13287/Bobra.27_2s0007.1
MTHRTSQTCPLEVTPAVLSGKTSANLHPMRDPRQALLMPHHLRPLADPLRIAQRSWKRRKRRWGTTACDGKGSSGRQTAGCRNGCGKTCRHVEKALWSNARMTASPEGSPGEASKP